MSIDGHSSAGIKSIPLAEDDSDEVQRLQAQLQEAEELRSNARTQKEKLAAAAALELAKAADKADKVRHAIHRTHSILYTGILTCAYVLHIARWVSFVSVYSSYYYYSDHVLK